MLLTVGALFESNDAYYHKNISKVCKGEIYVASMQPNVLKFNLEHFHS